MLELTRKQKGVSENDVNYPDNCVKALTQKQINFEPGNKSKMNTIKKQSFPVLEMTCAACAVSVESILKSAKGIKTASVNYANQQAYVEWDESLINTAGIQNAVRSIGYDLLVNVENAGEKQEAIKQENFVRLKKRTIWSAIMTIPVVIIGMFLMDMPGANWISLVLTTPVVFYFGGNFFIGAFKKIRHRQANMDTLVALSTGIAYVFSVFNTLFPEFWHARGLHAHVYYEAAAVIVVFVSLGKLLEEKAKSNTSTAIKKLIGLQPKSVKVLRNKKEETILVSELVVGDTVIVKPGEKIAVDGVVESGGSFIDESMISGEPLAVEKTTGNKVFAGTINQKGTFTFKAEKVGSDTLLSQIIKMVQEAQGSKAPVQNLVDKIAGIFVPVVIVISLLTFVIWLVLGQDNAFTHALLNSITVLVIACPCALGLATPTAIMVGIGKGAENNILIKDAESLETGYKVNALVLDKTGTITEGKPEVTNMIWFHEENNDLQNVLFTMESRSGHPLAEAVLDKFKSSNVSLIGLQNFESITGMGISAEWKAETYYVGNKRLLMNKGITGTTTDDLVEKLQKEGKTVVFFASARQVLAMIAIADKIKNTSKAAIATLQERGIEVYMLTGDNQPTAESVAKEVGISKYKAETLPSDKADFIKKLQAEGMVVAMVGDGINDSQALAQADLSIAMGKGSDIAIDVAKMTLISSDLQAIPKALQLSKKVVQGIRQNLFWAFIYNLIGIPVAAGILYPVNGFLLNPMIAGAAMALSSVSVVGNSLRLKIAKL